MIPRIEDSERIGSTSADEEHPKECNRNNRPIPAEEANCPIPVTREVVDLVAVSEDSNTREDEEESGDEGHTEEKWWCYSTNFQEKWK